MIDLPSPALIGVIHLPALPGSPCHQLPVDEIVERARAEAQTLKKASFDAVLIENFGDVPFQATGVEPATVAAMAVVAERVRRDTGLMTGINVLRNDARAALGIAAAAGAVFIRVNVHTGVSATDQVLMEGRAGEILRYRKRLAQRIAILADVHVKHAIPLDQPDIARAARDAAYRGLAGHGRAAGYRRPATHPRGRARSKPICGERGDPRHGRRASEKGERCHRGHGDQSGGGPIQTDR